MLLQGMPKDDARGCLYGYQDCANMTALRALEAYTMQGWDTEKNITKKRSTINLNAFSMFKFMNSWYTIKDSTWPLYSFIYSSKLDMF